MGVYAAEGKSLAGILTGAFESIVCKPAVVAMVVQDLTPWSAANFSKARLALIVSSDEESRIRWRNHSLKNGL